MKEKVVGWRSKRVFFLWWLCFLLGVCSEKTTSRFSLLSLLLLLIGNSAFLSAMIFTCVRENKKKSKREKHEMMMR